jgi:mRNA-degrading endonuclease RelE of RelBE toxin-antitoxin system
VPWQLRVARRVEKSLRRLAPKDQRLIRRELEKLRLDPRTAHLQPLHTQPTGYRLDAGNWRLMVDLYPDILLADVSDLVRRTTTTYRKRH